MVSAAMDQIYVYTCIYRRSVGVCVCVLVAGNSTFWLGIVTIKLKRTYNERNSGRVWPNKGNVNNVL